MSESINYIRNNLAMKWKSQMSLIYLYEKMKISKIRGIRLKELL